MTNELQWHPPDNVYIEIDGVSVRVPDIEDQVLEYVTNAPDGDICEMMKVVNWLTSLTDVEVYAALQYFTDQWTWETGHELDKLLLDMFEIEHTKRNDLRQSIETVIQSVETAIQSAPLTKLLDRLGKLQKKEK